MHTFHPKMCECHHRYATLVPGNPAHTALIYLSVRPGSATRYLQHDLGVDGVPVTSVRVMHWHQHPEDLLSSNNMTVTVLDPAGSVVFQHTFTGITQNSPVYDDFDMNGQKLPPGSVPFP